MAKQTWVGSDRVKPVLLEKIPANTDEFYAHKISTTGEHGISSTIVGTDEEQTLTNKTLITPDIQGLQGLQGDIVGTSAVQTLTNKTLVTPDIQGLQGLPGDIVTTLATQTLTNKTLVTPDIQGLQGLPGDIVTTSAVQTLTNKTLVTPDIQGLQGLPGDIVTTSATQTLTNKTILIVEPVLPEEPATKNYVDQTAFKAVLPDMAGHADTLLHTDGTIAQWKKVLPGMTMAKTFYFWSM